VVGKTYREEGPDYSWVTPQEYAALPQLSGFVPAGSVVAANPYRGGMFFYVASGVEVFYPTENSLMLPDRRLIGTSLTLVESLPAVCSAAARHRVEYVLTGGSMHIWGVLDHTAEYAGVDAVADNPRFEVVAQSGPYTLRRVPKCTPESPTTPGMPGGGLVGPQVSARPRLLRRRARPSRDRPLPRGPTSRGVGPRSMSAASDSRGNTTSATTTRIAKLTKENPVSGGISLRRP
jgi:hypothetical protein